jgi:hypothetical protein
MMLNPRVTNARNHSLNLTHVKPTRNPAKADTNAPSKSPNQGMDVRIVKMAVAYPPMPRNAAWPKDA